MSENVRERAYPFNLLSRVDGVHANMLNAENFSKDQYRGLAAALSMLPEKEADVLRMRYQQCLSLEEIGKHYHVTKEAIRAQIARSFKKLGSKRSLSLISLGLDGYIEDNIARRVTAVTTTSIRQEYLDGYREGFLDAHTTDENGNIRSAPKKALALSIEDVGLSVRTYNVLRKNDVHYLSDLLLYMDKPAIASIPCLGRKSAEEVARMLRSYGIHSTAWDSFIS